MAYKIGDNLVYPHHGAVVVEGREKRNLMGEETDYLVLRSHDGMILSVPEAKAADLGIRKPVDGAGVKELYKVLGKKASAETGNWSRRYKLHQEKMKTGDVNEVAAVVRNLAIRDAEKGLSAGEKGMLEKARAILVSEVAVALGVPHDEAGRRIDSQIKRPKAKK